MLRRILAAAALLAAGLLSGAATAQTTLRIGLAEDPDVLDPTLARTYVGRIVFASLCDKLVDIGPDLQIVPQLATEWRWTDDNKALVMKLRQGVTFQDGEKMDAAAVKFSLERHLTMPGSNRKAEISAVKSVEIVDDHTVKLVLDKPFAPLLAQLSDRAGMIVSPKAAQAEGDKFGQHPICAGPFKFTERVAQDRIVLDRFADYWNKDAIHVDRIVFLPIADSTVRLSNLQSGQLDLIERVAATDLDTVRKDARLKLSAITSLAYTGITINTANGERAKNPLGQDQRVREALELSIDRAALNQVVFNGEFMPGNQWVSPEHPYYQKDLPVQGRDLEKAKALLKEAGVTGRLSVDFMVPSGAELHAVAEVIQAMAAEVGIDMKIRVTEFATSLKAAEAGQYQAYMLAWSGRTDPDGNLYSFYKCKAPLNYPGYCNPEVDKLLDQSRVPSDPAARKAIYAQLAKILLNDDSILYLYHRRILIAHTARLEGYTQMPDGLVRVVGLKFK